MMGTDGFINVRIQREGGKQDRGWPAGESEEESQRQREEEESRIGRKKEKKDVKYLDPEQHIHARKTAKERAAV